MTVRASRQRLNAAPTAQAMTASPKIASHQHAGELAADRAAESVSRGTAMAQTRPNNELHQNIHGLPAPKIVNQVLNSAGQPLGKNLRTGFEARFGQDFSSVRVHNDNLAHRSASAISARAFSSGNHIVFGKGEWRPDSVDGQKLVAHELAHQAHNRVGTDGYKAIWRKPTFDLNNFDTDTYGDETLLNYLKFLRENNHIEDNSDSDDKARAIVKKWRLGPDEYALEPVVKALLIKEMQSGFTGDDDERAILNLLEFSAPEDVESMFSNELLNAEDLDSDFQGEEEDALREIYDRIFKGGRKVALEGGVPNFNVRPETALAKPYNHANLRAVIDEKISRIASIMRDRPQDQRHVVVDQLIRAQALKLQKEFEAFPVEEQARIGNDLAGDRTQRNSQSKAVNKEYEVATTDVEIARIGRKQDMLTAEVKLLDLIMPVPFGSVAMTAPKTDKEFKKLTTPLSKEKQKEAREAITPMTEAEIVAEATGVAAPPPVAFHPDPLHPGEDNYETKISKRIPDLIKAKHVQMTTNKTEKEHSDPKLTRSMDDMQVIANQAKDDVDLVFGSFYEAKKFSAFQGDKRDDKGKLTKKGNLRDVWQVEEDRRNANKNHETARALFWLFYLITNDDVIKNINLEHDASPSWGKESKPLNSESKLIRKSADPFLVTQRTELFEIGRGWPAFEESKDIFIQLFKNPDSNQDRSFLWGKYMTLMHEYLHKLAHERYDKYANKLGGEHSTEGNTLIEGVDSFLTSIAWTEALKRVATPEIRGKVEPDAVAAGLPFDPDLLPYVPSGYDSYEQVIRLIRVVGIHNLYAAYFHGRIELIGGSL